MRRDEAHCRAYEYAQPYFDTPPEDLVKPFPLHRFLSSLKDDHQLSHKMTDTVEYVRDMWHCPPSNPEYNRVGVVRLVREEVRPQFVNKAEKVQKLEEFVADVEKYVSTMAGRDEGWLFGEKESVLEKWREALALVKKNVKEVKKVLTDIDALPKGCGIG